MIDIMKLHGSLCHLVFVYQEGRIYLPSLSNFVASFSDNLYMECYPTSDVMRNVEWWEKALSGPGMIHRLFPLGPHIDQHLYVDASTAWGIGVLFDGRWDAWCCSGEWCSKARHIGWLEGLALELLIYIIEEQGLRDVHLLVHSDNKGVISAFDKGRSRNFKINLSIRRSASVLATRNITLHLTYIESACNPADPISHGKLGSSSSRIRSRFALPEDLLPFLIHV
jgi:hypothetical protein